MPEMRVARGTAHLSADHAVTRIAVFDYSSTLARLVKAWPAGTGIKLRLRIEQRRSAAHTVIHPRFLGVPILPREGAFGSSLAGDVILLVSQLLFPLGFALNHFFGHESSPFQLSVFIIIRCSVFHNFPRTGQNVRR